jgi:hypothetical protein
MIAFILKITTSIDQELVNEKYEQLFESEYNYIYDKINDAHIQYGIKFEKETIITLKK